MRKKEKAKRIQQILDQLYPEPKVPLYHTSEYTLLIAVLLSAKCTDARVNLVTPQLFAKADTPEKMIQLQVIEIQEIIRSCGLSEKKAEAIWQLSSILLDQYQGQVPSSFEELESLPGVGHKTASVVMAQGFNYPAFPVDTHIHRCALRWKLSVGKNVSVIERDLKMLFPKKDWIKLHLQIIYFAREYCLAKMHEAKICPICSWI